ncbi:SagB/ThcOx family dehydrogenase [Yoonia sp. I 8.24]|uniref:SagB/ThcOx family dehydrogenase n=1 Tax=Yoonia sp. I 8.24 TaxID=1537229 RepID=UPI001EE11113|nr:SagB/ThcOx family dehydrogenase [Yoonia sp. I 8.24]
MSSDINDTTGLSRLFHLNSEPWVNENLRPNAPFSQETKNDPNAARIALPDTAAGTIDRLASARRSTRAFADTPLALHDFAALLRAGYKTLGPDKMEGGMQALRRPVPSAGGLYPLEIYALVRNVDGLAKGIYHYDSKADDLEIVHEGPWESQARDAFLTWSFVAEAPVVLCIGAVFARTQRKYGPRGYRYILIEAGHVTQNLCLAATDMTLSSLCLGGYSDSVLNDLIGLDGLTEAIIYAVGLGAAAHSD